MKVYVAGKWEDRQRCANVMEWFRLNGDEITCDWTDHKYEDEAYPKKYCMDDVQGVKDADIFVGVFIAPFNYRGALVEMGIALGAEKPIYLIGNQQNGCVFANHPLVKLCPRWDEFADYYQKQEQVK